MNHASEVHSRECNLAWHCFDTFTEFLSLVATDNNYKRLRSSLIFKVYFILDLACCILSQALAFRLIQDTRIVFDDDVLFTKISVIGDNDDGVGSIKIISPFFTFCSGRAIFPLHQTLTS